MSLVKTPLS